MQVVTQPESVWVVLTLADLKVFEVKARDIQDVCLIVPVIKKVLVEMCATEFGDNIGRRE